LFKKIDHEDLVYLPKNCRIEGGDIILHDEYIFIGTCEKNKFDEFKTARTNLEGIDFIRQYFADKKIISFPLIKSDTDCQKLALHLDCCFQPVGKNKLVVCPEAFHYKRDFNWILNNFKKENIFEISLTEMSRLKCNFFSISENIVVSETSFSKLNNWLRANGITVEEINYNEISKQGGLFRCTTLPLIRE
jgi:N-dimethylarginine dimethylaminohydrolase